MKKCTIGLFLKILVFLVFAGFYVPLMGISFYFAFLYPQTPHEERLIFLAGVVICGGLVAFAIYRSFILGLIWVEYDMEKVIFHYSRKKEYRFQWEEIPSSQVQVGRADGGYVFCIQENGRQRKIPLNRLSKGYKDFEKTLELAGVLHRIGVKTQEEFKRDASQKTPAAEGGCGKGLPLLPAVGSHAHLAAADWVRLWSMIWELLLICVGLGLTGFFFTRRSLENLDMLKEYLAFYGIKM